MEQQPENKPDLHFFFSKVMSPAPQAMSLRAHELPFQQRPGLLHLESCGDLSTFTAGEGQSAERRIQRAEHERPHSLIGVVRETVLWGGFSLFLRRVFLSGIHGAQENHLWQAGGRGRCQPIFYTPVLRLPMGSSFCKPSEADCELTCKWGCSGATCVCETASSAAPL